MRKKACFATPSETIIVSVHGGKCLSTRRPPTHPVKPGYVLGPTRHVQGVQSSSALRAYPVLRAIWRSVCPTRERLLKIGPIERDDKLFALGDNKMYPSVQYWLNVEVFVA
jgi:hypothetical protein